MIFTWRFAAKVQCQMKIKTHSTLACAYNNEMRVWKLMLQVSYQGTVWMQDHMKPNIIKSPYKRFCLKAVPTNACLACLTWQCYWQPIHLVLIRWGTSCLSIAHICVWHAIHSPPLQSAEDGNRDGFHINCEGGQLFALVDTSIAVILFYHASRIGCRRHIVELHSCCIAIRRWWTKQ